MKIIILKKVTLKLGFILVVACVTLTIMNCRLLPVYKDREHWEKTGAVIWEVAIKQKSVAMTFDDGPSPTFTEKILDLLARYHAKGTFFVVGKQAEKYPSIIRRESDEGHEVSNHTYNHPEVNRMTVNELKQDLVRAHQVIHRIIGKDMKLFRPTSGFYNDKIVEVARALNYTIVIWTWGLDSRDWTRVSGENIALRIIKTVRPGTIILFHDQGGDHSNTVRALEIILPVLRDQGYQFTTVSTLLNMAKNP